MATVGGWVDAKLFAGGYNFTGDVNSIGLTYSAAALDGSTFGSFTKVNVAGLKDIAVNASGFVNAADNVQDEQAFGNIGQNAVPVSIMPGNTPVEGSIGYFFRASVASYQFGGRHGDMLGFSFNAAGGDGGHPLLRGFVLEPGSTARIITGAGAGTNNPGAVGANQYLYAALHVVSASVADTLDVIIQSDADGNFGAGATTRITFAQVAAVGSQYATRVAGPITDAYWRASWTITGTDPSFTFAVVMGIGGA